MVNMDDIRVVFVEPLFEINIGYIARTMKNFGIKELYIVKPRTSIGKTSLIFSAHAKDIIRNVTIVDKLEEAISNVDYVIGTTGKFSKSDLRVLRIPITPEELGINLASYEGKVALLFGREDIGLKNNELELCDVVVVIPANIEYPILNVSHAAAIIFYEIYKYNVFKKMKKPFGLTRAKREEISILLKFYNNIVDNLKMPEFRKKIAKMIFKRMVGRAFLTGREVYTLIGVFRKIYETLPRDSSTKN